MRVSLLALIFHDHLQVYPHNPSLLSMHARAGLLAHLGSRLRLDLWTAAERNPASLPLRLLLVAVEGHMVAQAPRLLVNQTTLQMLL